MPRSLQYKRGASKIKAGEPKRWPRRLGLRARVTVAYALLALVLSAAMATITYFTARQALLSQRISSAEREAFVNATFVRSSLRTQDVDFVRLLGSLDTAGRSRSILFARGSWYASSVGVTQNNIPLPLRQVVLGGKAAFENFYVSGHPDLAVGVPVQRVNASYFDVFVLDDLRQTLQTLVIVLTVTGIVTTLGGALLGRWASRRALRPLADVAHAATGIAGGKLGTRLATQDEADLATLVSSFNRMADNLQSRIEREARFTSDVSHELRSPLTTLVNSVEVLQTRRGELSERSCQALDLLASELRRFQNMVDGLLEISRFDAGAAELAVEEVGMGELVHNVVLPTCGASVPLTMTHTVARMSVRVDKRRFERIIANLVENASLYAGGVTGLVVAADEQRVRIAIEDAGPGIPPEDRLRVFERFYRSPGRRHGSGGAGLGLALVAEHVRLHGGDVWVEEAGGHGARFVVELPAIQDRGIQDRAIQDRAIQDRAIQERWGRG